MECCGISPGICLLCLSGMCSFHVQNILFTTFIQSIMIYACLVKIKKGVITHCTANSLGEPLRLSWHISLVHTYWCNNNIFISLLEQCHLYLFHSSLKKLKSLSLLSVIVLCNVFLFGLRNIWQLLFHMSVASISTLLILSRKLQDRTNDCGV